MIRSIHTLPVVALMLGTAACMTGPDYAGPPEIASAAQRRSGFLRAPADMAIRPIAVSPWWRNMNDPVLAQLIETALATSPTTKSTLARLDQARAGMDAARADRRPMVGALAAAAGGTGGPATAKNPELYMVGLNASWELDFAGGNARRVERLQAQQGMAEAARDDAHVRLAADIGMHYATLRDMQQRLVWAERDVQALHQMHGLVLQREAAGSANVLEVEQVRTDLERSEIEGAQLRAGIVILRDQLALLTGVEPGGLDDQLSSLASVPLPPAEIAVGNPADLLRRRPDVRQAERRLAAANAQIGEAMAARFPKVTLLGLLGYSGLRLSDVGNQQGIAAAAIPVLQWNALDLGRIGARIDQARALHDEAGADYRQAVLAALQDAEGALVRYGELRQRVLRLTRQRDSAQTMAAMIAARHAGGAASRIETLTAQRRLYSCEQQLLAATAMMTSSYIALQKSLGLGWDAE